MLQAQPYAVEQQNNGEHSDRIHVGHYFLKTSCVTIPHAVRITQKIQKPV